jgi:hypothetical protein
MVNTCLTANWYKMGKIPINPCFIRALKGRCLAGGEGVGGGIFHIHKGQRRNFQALLSPAVRTAVELIQTLGVPTTFLTKAAIHHGNEPGTLRQKIG